MNEVAVEASSMGDNLMEAGLLSKLLTALLLLGAVIYLLFLRPWRPRRMWALRVAPVDLLFVAALAAGLASLHAQSPFPQSAWRVVQLTNLPETLGEVDLEIQLLRQWPEQRWNEFMAGLGWSEPEPFDQSLAEQTAWVSDAVLPSVTAVVEILLRGGVYWGSLMVMAVCLVLRLTIGLTRSIRNLGSQGAQTERIAELEQKLATLEARLDAGSLPA